MNGASHAFSRTTVHDLFKNSPLYLGVTTFAGWRLTGTRISGNTLPPATPLPRFSGPHSGESSGRLLHAFNSRLECVLSLANSFTSKKRSGSVCTNGGRPAPQFRSRGASVKRHSSSVLRDLHRFTPHASRFTLHVGAVGAAGAAVGDADGNDGAGRTWPASFRSRFWISHPPGDRHRCAIDQDADAHRRSFRSPAAQAR